MEARRAAGRGARAGRPAKPSNNVYTVLLVLATLFMAAATVYVGIRGSMLYDDFWKISFGG
jgi:hypothetical protein